MTKALVIRRTFTVGRTGQANEDSIALFKASSMQPLAYASFGNGKKKTGFMLNRIAKWLERSIEGVYVLVFPIR